MAIDPELSQEFDTGVDEDVILAKGGHYAVGTVPGKTWKALVLIGSVTTIVGLAFVLLARSSIYPIGDYWPTPLGSALILTVPVAGILILIAGLGIAARNRRDPPLEPIV